MRAEAGKGFATATDLADLLMKEYKLPFRRAHTIVGRAVRLGGLELGTIERAAMETVGISLVDRGLTEASIREVLDPAAAVLAQASMGNPASKLTNLAVTGTTARPLLPFLFALVYKCRPEVWPHWYYPFLLMKTLYILLLVICLSKVLTNWHLSLKSCLPALPNPMPAEPPGASRSATAVEGAVVSNPMPRWTTSIPGFPWLIPLRIYSPLTKKGYLSEISLTVKEAQSA
jgi:hypothetical protein